LQEHDNKVQFRNIQINAGWIPRDASGTFDSSWQKEADQS